MTQRSALLLLFFCSGFAALAYEVIWIRLLSLTLSITVYSLTTVLCAFMAGLGIGASVAARVADRIRRPLLAFGLAELGIAGCGLAAPAIIFRMGPAYVWLHEALGGAGIAFAGSRFLLAAAVLLVPCSLMGFTLPVLARAFVEDEKKAGGGAGALYAANTLGAVGGCVAAGFVLIPAFGLSVTSAAAAALNVAIGGLAIAFGGRIELPARAEDARPEGVALSAEAKLAAVVFGFSGFCAMGYEVLWTRALEHYTHNSTYAYSAMLATFLAGIGLGSAAMARFSDRLRRPVFAIALLQVAIGVTVIVGLRTYMRFETLVPGLVESLGGLTSWRRVVMLLFSEAGVTMFSTTLLLGAMFPPVARLAVGSIGTVGRGVGLAYASNTVGSILGSLAVGFAALPLLGVRNAFVSLVALNLAIGLLLALREGGRRGALLAATAAGAGVVAVLILPARLFEDQFIARFGKLLLYREEVTDTVMVTEAQDGSRMIRYADGRGTAGTITVREDRMYAHIPLLLHPEPRRVLQIGFGVGNTLSSTLTYPVEAVDCVELSPGVIDAAPFFRETNRDALSDPRVRLVINDGRNFVLTSPDRYDVIRMDPPELHTAGVVNLYTRDFFEQVRDHLAGGGIFSVWINAVMTPIEDIQLLLRTFRDVFPHVSVWTSPALYSWVINASMEPHAPDLEVLARKFERPEVQADLDSIGIDDPLHFAQYFVFTDPELSAFTGTGPVVMDDHTRLDFTVPRSVDAYYGIANYNTNVWLVQLMEEGAPQDAAARVFLRKVRLLQEYRAPVVPHLRNADAAGLDRDELTRRLAPTPEVRRDPARGGVRTSAASGVRSGN